MEYAEGGSLFNVLHKSAYDYTLAHAMSWAYQCAKGVQYLHAMKPKPLIHRDLKPPNLLLINGGISLKICDFGTAADKNTYMTNNKGSAAWMAPEVFTSNKYTERCDIFSWGIILWEVLSRRKPFYNQGGSSAFSIMWAVHKGRRPPLIRNCPAPIESLMTESWNQDPNKRPSMDEIVSRMELICFLLPGAEEPISCREQVYDDDPLEELEEISSDENDSDESVTVGVSVETNKSNMVRSLPQPDESMKVPLAVDIDPECWALEGEQEYEIQTMPGFDISIPRNRSQNTVTAGSTTEHTTRSNQDVNDISVLLDSLDPHLRPATPDFGDPRSVELYEEHAKMAPEYWKIQTELILLEQKKNQLLAAQAEEEQRQRTLRTLQEEKESLRLIRDLLQQQKDRENQNGGVRSSGDGWVIVPHGERRE
ncbi:mitogen-activated protein kinase kinase kinase 7-like isoform X2 [Cylas formicarius]|nr:mitogen-activated protein kinase kinase kinase 7-like isoform X2 [Cylas formicarius]